MEFFSYLLKSSLVLTVFLGAYHLLLRRETLFSWNRHFLLSGILISILLPLWEITQTVIVEVPASVNPIGKQLYYGADTQNHMVEPSVVSLDPELLLTYVYSLGIILLLLYIGHQLWNLFRLIQKHPKKSIKGIWHVLTKGRTAPFSFLKYIVYNPEQHSQEELKMIVAHETIHVNERHSFDMFLAQLLVIFQWFNPIAWWYRRAISENLEFLADQKTSSQVSCQKSYQLALVRTSSVVSAPLLTNSFYQSFIKKRIIMLNKNQSNRWNALKALAILPFLALFFYGFNVTTENKYVEIPIPAEIEIPMEEENLISAMNPNAEINSKTTDPSAYKQPMRQDSQLPKEAPGNEIVFAAYDFERTINKNTSDSELEAIKKEMKEKYGLNFSYSRQRNAAGEIVSLSMNYSGHGKNGNYQVTDEDGIEEFTFYFSEDGKSGFYSEANEIRRDERRAEMEERRSQMREEMEGRRKEMDERREVLDERREEMDERREYRLQQMEERREERLKEMEDRREAQRNREAEIHEIDDEHQVYRVRQNPGGEIIVVDEIGPNSHYEIHDDSETVIVRGQEAPIGVITKNTTDAELEKLKTDLSKQGVEFSYRNVKRNTKGEIKSIKFTVKDGQGKSTTNVRGTDDDPIEPILIQS